MRHGLGSGSTLQSIESVCIVFTCAMARGRGRRGDPKNGGVGGYIFAKSGGVALLIRPISVLTLWISEGLTQA